MARPQIIAPQTNQKKIIPRVDQWLAVNSEALTLFV
jgi:hypothetical protein